MQTVVVERSSKGKAFYELLKFRLTSSVVFSAMIGYYLGSTPGSNPVVWWKILFFAVGSFCITGAANIINQIIEKDLDALMKRTHNRPLPSKALSVKETVAFGIGLLVVGIVTLLVFTTWQACALSLLSMILYGFVYTPLKRKGPIAVFVGALPGALPPLIGWMAINPTITPVALIIFGIQFFWQFPHFWAIAWVLDDDYKKAGFKLLPGGGKKDLATAFQIMIFALFLIPLGLLPAQLEFTTIRSAFVATVCGILFLGQTFWLMKQCDRKAAKLMMFGSFFYLPIVQISYALDKL